MVDGVVLRLRCWLVPDRARALHDVYLQARPVTTDQPMQTSFLSQPGGEDGASDRAVQIERVRARWGLRRRQTEVLAALVHGRSNKEIAAALGCAEVTVEYHVTSLFRRTGVSNRAALVSRFWREP